MDADSLFDKELPSDLEAERAVLGAPLLNNDLIDQASKWLGRDDFFLTSHKLIFDAQLSLRNSGNPIDPITLHALLKDRGVLDQVGGVAYLATLGDGVPRSDTVEYPCRIVKQKARERLAIKELYKATVDLLDGEQDPNAILMRVTEKITQIHEDSNKRRGIQGFYPSLEALIAADLSEAEEIFYSVRRGDVAGLLAVTNYGKTTLLLNLALKLTAGEICLPLADEVLTPRRVLWLDFETPPVQLRRDILTMLQRIDNPALAKQNFIIGVDASINGEPLNLSRVEHFKRVMAWARGYKVDLVVVDTAASAFELQDENSNAEVTRRVLNPLKRLAREANCAVVFTHHIGKANETQTGEAAYRGRGASAFGALSRVIFTLEKDSAKGPEYVVLSCAKAKGESIQPTLMRLNILTRWFEVCQEAPTAKPVAPTAQEIADFVAEQEQARTEDIATHFKGRASARTIVYRVTEAERLGLI
jgi:replicative DNA helicase